MVVVKIDGNLNINENVVVEPYGGEYGGPNGLFIIVTGTLECKGIIKNTKGAYSEGQDVFLYQNSNGSYEYIPKEGGNGGEGVSFTGDGWQEKKGNDGKNATLKRSTGGGGAGAVKSCYSNGNSGSGSNGTSYSGGAGGGACTTRYGTRYATEAILSKGGDAASEQQTAGGGAGNPYGKGSNAQNNGKDGTGGLIVIYANKIKFTNDGKVDVSGTLGGSGNAYGGSSGGGSINIFYAKSFDCANLERNFLYDGGNNGNGGKGGDGSFFVGSIGEGTYKSYYDSQNGNGSEIEEAESILSFIENKNNTDIYLVKIKDIYYYIHLYVYNNDQEWNENKIFGDEYDVATEKNRSLVASNMVAVKVNGDLTINSGVSVAPYASKYGGPKGMLLFCTGTLTNRGTILNRNGAKAIGENVYLWRNSNGSYEYIPAVGANPGSSFSFYGQNWQAKDGNTGENATNRGLGGGGSGSAYTCYSNGIVGAGSTATSYSAGAGGRSS